jgi:translation initiation factor 2 beta subunit (eIF-2beta)/eIF-5
MKRLFEILWHGHCHKWVVIHETNVFDGHQTEDRLPIGRKYTMQCEKCGNIKYKKDF